MRIVVDTNVIISGLMSPAGPPGRILDLLLTGRAVAVYDDRILAEYHEVVKRPKLRIGQMEAGIVLDRIEREGIFVAAPPLEIRIPDLDDAAFIEVAVAGHAVALVTGNERHFAPAREYVSVPILSPAQFVEFWRTQQG